MMINWPDFTFSAINLWSIPKQYIDYYDYKRRTDILRDKHKEPNVTINGKITELTKFR